MAKVRNTIKPIFLFHKDTPKGEMFRFEGGKGSEQYKAKISEGWVDTPAKLDLPADMDTGISMEKAKNADPNDLKKLVESYGFIVITPEQLKAEAVKMANIAINIENFSDEDLVTEVERRGLVLSDSSADELNEIEDENAEEQCESNHDEAGLSDDLQQLLEQFNEDPESLNKDEHIKLGKGLGVSLRSNWGESVMIEKITKKLNSGEAE